MKVQEGKTFCKYCKIESADPTNIQQGFHNSCERILREKSVLYNSDDLFNTDKFIGNMSGAILECCRKIERMFPNREV